MFSKSSADFEFVKRGYSLSGDIDCVRYSAPPKDITGVKEGATLFMQYLESLMYGLSGYRVCKNRNIDELYEKVKVENGLPTFDSYMKAISDLGYVQNCKTVYFNDVDTLKFYLREYKAVPVEVLLTDTTKNAHEFEITDKGEVIEGYTKGFIAYRITDESILLQNSLGDKCGAVGFNKMPLELFDAMFVKGASFVVQEDGE